MSERKIAIIGAGLFGRTLAFSLLRKRENVTLFDKDGLEGKQSCAFAGAGMLAPYTELAESDPLICAIGIDATQRWRALVTQMSSPVFVQRSGTLIISHQADSPLMQQFYNQIRKKLATDNTQMKWLNAEQLHALEPSLAPRFSQALYAAEEGQIDNRQLLLALEIALNNANCTWKLNSHVDEITVRDRTIYEVLSEGNRYYFDVVVDCRGMGSAKVLKTLRGVRGELVEVLAPAVSLRRPIRLLHPRYPIYIVPRENHRFLIGATSIECEDYRPITVHSTLELLSAAYSVDPAFSEASIIDTRVNCRPAFPNNQPSIKRNGNLFEVNGLYRHGYLMTPHLVSLLYDRLDDKPIESRFLQILQEENQFANIH